MRESASTRQFPDVEELASQRAILAGFADPVSMPRLLDVVTTTPSPIAYRIEFTWDASGRPKMIGRVEGMLPLLCQRCLETLDWYFETRFETLVIGNEQEETNGRDAVVCSGGRIELEPMIEDELLLALPNAPVHARGSCEAPPIRATSEQPSSRPGNPFSALHALRSHHDREQSS